MSDEVQKEPSVSFMERRSIRERWPIPAELRPSIINRLIRDACDDSLRPRDRARAVAALAQLERMNQVDQLAAMAGGSGEGLPDSTTITTDEFITEADSTIPSLPEAM
jgi:hypothetical protein